MKSRGLTLIELLAVIAVIGIISSIILPTVFKNVRESKEKAYLEQTKLLEEEAKKWSIRNTSLLSETETYYLEIKTLVDEEYITSEEIIDPRNDEVMTGCIVVDYDKDNMQYVFDYNENRCEAVSYTHLTLPTIA